MYILSLYMVYTGSPLKVKESPKKKSNICRFFEIYREEEVDFYPAIFQASGSNYTTDGDVLDFCCQYFSAVL